MARKLLKSLGMNLYYFSCDCQAVGEHANMMADVCIQMPSKREAEEGLKQLLHKAGWRIKTVDHFELVTGIPVHDARLSGLINKAKQEKVATLFSPY